MTGYSLSTVESEFDDHGRANEEGLTYHVDISCSGCGNDLRLTTDPTLKHQWDVDVDTVCYSCGGRETIRDRLREAHKDDKPKKGDPAFMDGRILAVRFIEPAYLPGGE